MGILKLLEIEIVEGKADEAIEVIQKLLVDTRKRPGCIEVSVHQDESRPEAILFVERWASRSDDEAYAAWRAGDGAVPEMAALTAGLIGRRYFNDVDA